MKDLLIDESRSPFPYGRETYADAYSVQPSAPPPQPKLPTAFHDSWQPIRIQTMKKQILLPNGTFGLLLMLALIVLIITVPFVAVFWAVALVAPWWVALPCGLLMSLVTFLVTVKFRGRSTDPSLRQNMPENAGLDDTPCPISHKTPQFKTR
jgi:hypothetical protein